MHRLKLCIFEVLGLLFYLINGKRKMCGTCSQVVPGLQKTDFLPVQTDFKFVKPISVCIKRFFFGPKTTLCGSYIGPIIWISQVSNRLLPIIIPIINVVNTLELLNREK